MTTAIGQYEFRSRTINCCFWDRAVVYLLKWPIEILITLQRLLRVSPEEAFINLQLQTALGPTLHHIALGNITSQNCIAQYIGYTTHWPPETISLCGDKTIYEQQ